ncbi:unnamed protein product [Rotaria sp. Silwood1]|nr:unnamed protein product [Rotaria sp. Silwood1]
MLSPQLDGNGSLMGQRVLDLGCGAGYYTRRLKALSCSYILGVDISSAMIDLACDAQRQDSKHIEYMVANAKHLPPPEQPFDLVTGFHYLCYAGTREELLEMARVIFAQLDNNKPFIGLTNNVVAGIKIFDINRLQQYGLTVQSEVPIGDDTIPDGTKLIFTMRDKQSEVVCTLSNYYLSPAIYEQVFKEAGFKTFEWVPYQCDPDAPDKAFLDDYINCPPGIGLKVTK